VIFYALDVVTGLRHLGHCKVTMTVTTQNGTLSVVPSTRIKDHYGHDMKADAAAALVIVGCMRILASVCGAVLIARVRSRRRLMQLSCTVMGIAMAALAATTHLQAKGHGSSDVDPWWMSQWLPVIEASMFIFGYGLGMHNVPIVLITELCPAKVQAFTSAMAMSLCAISVFTVVKIFPWCITVLTMPGTYGFFAGVSVLAFAVSSLLIPHSSIRALPNHEGDSDKEDC